jgi:hypothetical protein
VQCDPFRALRKAPRKSEGAQGGASRPASRSRPAAPLMTALARERDT